MTQIPLPKTHLDLWFAWPDRTEVEAELACCYALISHEERERSARLVFARDRHVQVLTRALVRTVLGRYLDIAPSNLCFERNAFGKPDLVAAQKKASGLSFNVSHTDGLILLGATCSQTLGVDVETFEHDSLASFASEFMTAAELNATAQLGVMARQRRYLETWTLKEAYVKARSIGLSLPLREMAFDFTNPSRAAFLTTGTLAEETERWIFHRFTVGAQYVGAACVPAQESGLPSARAVSITPLFRRVEPIALNVTWAHSDLPRVK